MTASEPVTRIAVEVRDGRHVVRAVAGQLRAQRLHGPADRARIALVGQTALLLGGDRVAVEIDVGPGAVLELSDIAGTVAYHGRGLAASWQTRIRLGEGAHLTYAGLPLVVSDGADVTRTLTVDLAEGATARLRETLVLGRTGEAGGRLDASTLLRRSGEGRSGGELARERLLLEPGVRERPGVLAGVRVVDSVLRLGQLPREVATTPDPSSEGCATYFSADPTPSRSGSAEVTTRTDVITYELVDGESTLTRFLGTSLADSPLH